MAHSNMDIPPISAAGLDFQSIEGDEQGWPELCGIKKGNLLSKVSYLNPGLGDPWASEFRRY